LDLQEVGRIEDRCAPGKRGAHELLVPDRGNLEPIVPLTRARSDMTDPTGK
jgi:hypothetical protein